MGEGAIRPGAYEWVITEALSRKLGSLPADAVITRAIDSVEIPDHLSLLVSDLVRRTLVSIERDDRIHVGPEIVSRVIQVLTRWSEAVDGDDVLSDPVQILHSIGRLMPDGSWGHVVRPLTPLADTTLLTGARGEPTLLAQLRSEIPSADGIDILMAFIRQTGIRPLLSVLREHVACGKSLRILTTSYTGSTERRALDLLFDLGAEIKVSYDESGTRLHAKSWLFRRESGLASAYVGSSNLTFQAQVTGLEWNVRLSAQRNPESVEKLQAAFESYWLGGDFIEYEAREFYARSAQRSASTSAASVTFDLVPHPFQRRMLEQLALCRADGQHRNLVVAATGTGKTVLSAFDYKHLRSNLRSSRLLFVAHRKEILEQAITTFRHVLHDPDFGELWVDGERPIHFNHVFASIQSLSANAVTALDAKQFDVVIVDEFHHAAAKSYRQLLESIEPVELVGLTATPERMDGESILHWFDDRIAVELRLWDAIEQQRLAPFIYYGIDDDSNLSAVPRRGGEYEPEALGLSYQLDAHWISNVLRETQRLVPDLESLKALGFCASVSHAEFTARAFSRAGIPSAALSGQTPTADRRRTLAQLRAGEVQVIFSVDVLSEGVDIPNVNTVLLMRPTQSATIFLQQLGRGLRKAEGKGACLVLDFIGNQSQDFRFDLRYRALLGGSRTDLDRAVRHGFPYLPSGCQVNLDQVSADRILQSLRRAIPSSQTQQSRELARMAQYGDPSLGDFLGETGLDLSDVFRNGHSWMTLRLAAGLKSPTDGPYGSHFRKAIGRMLHLDDELRLKTFSDWLWQDRPPLPTSQHDSRLMRMLLATLTRSIDGLASGNLEHAAKAVWEDARLRTDLIAMFTVLSAGASSRGYPLVNLQGMPDVPLRIHARYTRDEILCALGCKPGSVRPPSWQSGVWFEEAALTDLLAFTLDKSGKSFSPSTRYRDYAITDTLIHWESQGATREASQTGQRYVNHNQRGSNVLLFARESVSHRAFWFLGPADFVRHEGERPMAITWRLHVPLPNDLFGMMAAAVA